MGSYAWLRVGAGAAVWVIGATLLALYGVVVFLDLPTPAGATYRQDLPASELAKWGVASVAVAKPATHWWDKAQGLRGWSVFPEGWAWPKLAPAPLDDWLPLLGLAILAVLMFRLLERQVARDPEKTPWLGLSTLAALGYGLEVATLRFKGPNLQQLLLERITDPFFTGYFTSALKIKGLDSFFARFDTTLRSAAWCAHCPTHGPAPVLFYWLPLQGLNALPSAWQEAMAWSLLAVGQVPVPSLSAAPIEVALLDAHAILLAAAAITFPLYGLARRLAGPQLALPLAGLGIVLPAMALMSPEFDQLYGTLAAILLYVGLRGVCTPRHVVRWGIAAGLFFAFCLYWSYALAILAIPLALLPPLSLAGALRSPSEPSWKLRGAASPRALACWAISLGLAAMLPWALLTIFGRFPILDALQVARRAQLGGITAVRPYVPWVAFNLVDFAQFVGLPLVCATLVTLVAWRSAPARPACDGAAPYVWLASGPLGQAVAGLLSRLNAFGVMFWGLVTVLDLSGSSRAEVSRLWIPLMPLGLLAIYQAVGLGQLTRRHVYALVAAQFAVCLFIGANWLTP